MRLRQPTPLQVAGRGALAGYAGMAVMAVIVKGVQSLRGDGGSDGPPDTWEDAEPPAKFAHRVIEGVAQRHVSLDKAGVLNNAMHLIYAPWLGVWYGVVQESVRARTVRHGLTFGGIVWALRLTLNPALKLKEPFWEDTPQRNVIDASFHLAFGLAVAAAYRQLEQR